LNSLSSPMEMSDMKRIAFAGALTIAALAPLAAAQAQVTVSVSTPEFGIRIGTPMPRPVYSVPVYVPAPPVVVATPVYLPPPVYAPPPPRYAPPPVVVRTVFVPAYRHYPYAPYASGARVAPGQFKHGKRKHRGPHRSYR
jgi:hypothetical protein